MNCLLIESQYFGTINYYKKLIESNNIQIEAHDYFVKMSFRNRTVIPGANGLIQLTVPIENGRNHKQLMHVAKISYRENWIIQHIRSIDSCYNRAPFFEYYRDDLFNILNKKHECLLELNMELLNWLLKQYKINLNLHLTDSFQANYLPPVIDYRNQILPKNYQHSDVGNLKYLQVFEDRIGFKSNMSIIDLLFCAGPTAVNLLTSNENQ